MAAKNPGRIILPSQDTKLAPDLTIETKEIITASIDQIIGLSLLIYLDDYMFSVEN